jgi:hypothetical protein
MNFTCEPACPSFASSVIGRENRDAQFPSPSHPVRARDPTAGTLANRKFFAGRMPCEEFCPWNLPGWLVITRNAAIAVTKKTPKKYPFKRMSSSAGTKLRFLLLWLKTAEPSALGVKSQVC